LKTEDEVQAESGRAAGQAGVLNLYLADSRQLFNSMDPAPFHQRDLDTEAAAYIVDWAREVPTGRPLRLVLHRGRAASSDESPEMLRKSVHDHFRRRALATRRQLQQLLRQGRYSLAIALVFLALVIVVGESVASVISRASIVALIQDSLVIGGWVALWHPLNIFLYDWWPIRAEARLFEQLSTMDVHTVDASVAGPGKAGEGAW
jgi:hypothetical protein